MYNYSQQVIFRQVYDRELSGVVYCNELQMKYFNLCNYPNGVFQLTKDRLFLMSVVIYFNNVSVLRQTFDDEMIALTDSGLIDYWTSLYTDDRFQSKRYMQRTPKKLNLNNMFAIFQICFALLIVCFFVFVLETSSMRCVWLKIFIDNITY